MVGELVGGENMMAFTPYGPRFKAQRKFTSMALGAQALPSYHYLIEKETHRFLARILTQPKESARCVRMYAGSLTLSVMYGYDVKAMDDEVLLLAEKALDALANEIASGGGIWPVDIFPILRHMPLWMPGSGFLKKAKKWKGMIERAVDVPYKYTLDSMVCCSLCVLDIRNTD